MTLLEGSISVDGTFAYAAQQAWILNATLRDNILFGKEFEEERFVSCSDIPTNCKCSAWSSLVRVKKDTPYVPLFPYYHCMPSEAVLQYVLPALV